MSIEPTADRPHVPECGIPASLEGLLPWSWAVERRWRFPAETIGTGGE